MNEKKELSRRGFLATATAASVGAVAMAVTARAVETQSSTPSPAAAPVTPAPAPGATAAASPGKATTGARKLDDVMKAAREKLYPRCRVCPECDGEACAGEVPGLGGIGSGASFKNNVTALRKIHLKMRTIHDVSRPDTTVVLFGQKLEIPILCAALGGTTYNMGAKMSEEEFIEASLGGAKSVGTIGLVADGVEDPLDTYKIRLAVVPRFGGIAVIKPRAQKDIIERIQLVEQAGALAVAVDVDAAGRSARAAKLGQVIEPKTPKQLRELVRSTKLPFILKGIMTPDEALLAIDVGAKGIVVSNHGGRVLDHTPGSAEVLAAIVDKVKGKITILADGGIRNGYDTLKMLALGAEVVLTGRPIVRGAHGGGVEGVAIVLSSMKSQLIEAMTLTGTATVRAVKRGIIS